MKRIILSIIISLWLTPVMGFAAEEIMVVTEDFPPFNYIENGNICGLATDVVKEMLKSLSVSDKLITVMPWARAYKLAMSQENVLIYSIVRCAEREKDFKWVGKLTTLRMSFVKLKIRDDIKVESIDDLRKYRMGLTRETAPEHILSKFNIQAKERLSRDDQVLNMLLTGRIDIMPTYGCAFKALIKKHGYNKELFEKVFCLKEESKDLYIAFSKQTDDELVKKYQKAFEIVNKSKGDSYGRNNKQSL